MERPLAPFTLKPKTMHRQSQSQVPAWRLPGGTRPRSPLSLLQGLNANHKPINLIPGSDRKAFLSLAFLILHPGLRISSVSPNVSILAREPTQALPWRLVGRAMDVRGRGSVEHARADPDCRARATFHPGLQKRS